MLLLLLSFSLFGSLVVAEQSSDLSATVAEPVISSTDGCSYTASSSFCTFSFNNPSLLYTFTAQQRNTPSTGALITVQLRDRCCLLPSSTAVTHMSDLQPHASFRVYAQGDVAYSSAVPSIAISPNTRSASVFLPLPEPGRYLLRVKLQLFNTTVDMAFVDYPNHYKVLDDAQGIFVNKFVLTDDFQQALELTVTKDENSSTVIPAVGSAAHESLPLCGSVNDRGLLYGRWLLGEKLPSPVQRFWWSDSVFDEFPSASFHPFHCRLDYTVDLQHVLQHKRWLHFTGDSNIRHLMDTMCEMSSRFPHQPFRGQVFRAPTHLNRFDPPIQCSANDGSWIITYTSWFWGKQFMLEDGLTFEKLCQRYDDTNLTFEGPFYGFPNCTRVLHNRALAEQHYPSMTYFGWGSHAAELGASTATRTYLENEILTKNYFKNAPVLFPLTTAVDTSLIPQRFGKQAILRNNDRIHSMNQLLIDIINDKYYQLHRQQHQDWWLPIFDVYSPTLAGFERFNADPVHFWGELQQQLVHMLLHFLQHAPNYSQQ